MFLPLGLTVCAVEEFRDPCYGMALGGLFDNVMERSGADYRFRCGLSILNREVRLSEACPEDIEERDGFSSFSA